MYINSIFLIYLFLEKISFVKKLKIIQIVLPYFIDVFNKYL